MKNRKISRIGVVALIFLLLLGSLVGCQQTTQTEEPETAAIDYLSYRGQAVKVGRCNIEQLLLSLGEDYTVQEGESCAGVGKDYIYRYPSLCLYVTALVDGTATVTTVKYTDDGAEHGGVRIGSPETDIVAVFGEPDARTGDRRMYFAEESTLSFTLRDGVVTLIILQMSSQY